MYTKISKTSKKLTGESLNKNSNRNGTSVNENKVKKREAKVKNQEINLDFDEPNPRIEQYEEQPSAGNSSNKRKKKGKKMEKKVYSLPGQKRDPPNERDPLRIFYESLYKLVPNSQLAAFWMMESGLLPVEEANKVYELKLQMKQNKS